jgi:hypothetical protein
MNEVPEWIEIDGHEQIEIDSKNANQGTMTSRAHKIMSCNATVPLN